MGLTERQRQEMRRNWFAPGGSDEEKQWLNSVLESGILSETECNYVREWLGGDGYGMRNHGFWEVAKERALGKVAHARAMKRHAGLPTNTWFVAYFASRGTMTQKQIAERLGLADENGIRYHMDRLRERIAEEYGWDLESVKNDQIGRWFLGM